MRISTISLGALLLAAAAPAFAQDDTATAPPKPFTVTGGATLTSDYRFRGVTQTDGRAAAQGTLNVNSAIGFYVGTWASTIDGRDGKTPALYGYGTEEVDLYGGFTKSFKGLGVDVGLLYYLYPGGFKNVNTDFFEPYASVTYTIGPVAAKAGAAYAWGGQDGLKGFDVKGGNDDNIYLYGEASVGVPTTPLTIKGHVGYSSGSLGSLNIPGSNDNNYLDWSATAEAVGGPFKVGVSYVDTDISSGRATLVNPRSGAVSRIGSFDKLYGRGSTVLGYIGVSF